MATEELKWYMITGDTYCLTDYSTTKSMNIAYNETICADEYGKETRNH